MVRRIERTTPPAPAHKPQGPKEALTRLKEGSTKIRTFMKDAGKGMLGAGTHTISDKAPSGGTSKKVTKVMRGLI